MRLGRNSGGLSVRRQECPSTRRLKPRTGLIRPAVTSRSTRSEPVAWLSNTSEDTTAPSVSPRVTPPRLVFQKSLGEGAHRSPMNPHIRLPAKDQGAERQKS